jgi:hypothetical protein
VWKNNKQKYKIKLKNMGNSNSKERKIKNYKKKNFFTNSILGKIKILNLQQQLQ